MPFAMLKQSTGVTYWVNTDRIDYVMTIPNTPGTRIVFGLENSIHVEQPPGSIAVFDNTKR